MTTLHVITPTYRQATDYGKDLGFTLAAIKHITQASQLLSLHRAEIHVLPEARDMHNYADLIRRATAKQATLVDAEEA